MAIEINLEGKTVAVTGGGRGIGRAIAILLAEAGADVWIGNRKEEQSQGTVKEIQALGRKSGYTVMDVVDSDGMDKFLDDAEKLGNGKLDIMINAAGVIDTDSFLNMSDAQFRKLLDINTVGVNNALQGAIKKMIPHKAGKIVVISSFAGRKGLGLLAQYLSLIHI